MRQTMKKYVRIAFVALFVSTLGFQLPHVEAQNWTRFDMSNSELGNSVLAMAADKRNNKWFGTDLGMARLTCKTWTEFSMFNEKLKGQ